MTRDIRMRCIKCGEFSAGKPMCEECMWEVLREEEARRRRMSIVFTFIVILGIVTYYYII